MLADPNPIEIRTGPHPFYVYGTGIPSNDKDPNPNEITSKQKGNESEYYKSIDYNYTKEI